MIWGEHAVEETQGKNNHTQVCFWLGSAKPHEREMLEMAKQQHVVPSEVAMSFHHMSIRLHYSCSFAVSVSSILRCTI